MLPIFKVWATAQNLFALGCFGNQQHTAVTLYLG